ncbi:hypothetical protein L1887_48971 [Cichorium endivia]|nr:hypothetical protein L1887_48971 [Cichorium endivia]
MQRLVGGASFARNFNARPKLANGTWCYDSWRTVVRMLGGESRFSTRLAEADPSQRGFRSRASLGRIFFAPPRTTLQSSPAGCRKLSPNGRFLAQQIRPAFWFCIGRLKPVVRFPAERAKLLGRP